MSLGSVLAARRGIRDLLDDSSPVDAPTAYYALFHPPERSVLFTELDDQGKTVAFVGRFQTGIDLFRPVVTLHAATPESTASLLNQALVVGRPYIVFAALNQLSMIGGSFSIQNQRILRIYSLNSARFQPQVNVMVEVKKAPDGKPRCEINANGQVQAVAGLNWQSPAFAEIYVHTEPAARQKGWGRSVVSTLTDLLLRDGIHPIYLVENGNEASQHLIESLGYVDTGSRQVYAETVYNGLPAIE